MIKVIFSVKTAILVIVLCFGIAGCSQPAEPGSSENHTIINTDESNTSIPSPSPADNTFGNNSENAGSSASKDLSSWVGKYTFYEYAPPDQNMWYEISIYTENGNYYATVTIDGFQTNQRYKAEISGDEKAIDLVFSEYLPYNGFELYTKGDRLLSFEKKDSQVITYWGEMKPMLISNEEPGKTYFAYEYHDVMMSPVSNPFFFTEEAQEPVYKGKFLFNDMFEKDVKLQISNVGNMKYGILYELKLEPVEEVPAERLSLGYFYVQDDRIYEIEPSPENLELLKAGEGIPENSMIVCQDTAIKDSLGEDETGWHHYLTVNGNRREYHAYNNQVSTGYFETMIWERDKGLVYYRSGYGAERELVEIQMN